MVAGMHAPYLDDHYYVTFAAAYCRGRLGLAASLPDPDAIDRGRLEGLRLHKFKRALHLPRVRRILGILRGLSPSSLLDIGSGRDAFLWPLLDTFPELPVTTLDSNDIRVRDLCAVSEGGVGRLQASCADAHSLPFSERSFDVVTILEVLEHVAQVERAAREAVRVASRFLLASVPSKPDDNPEHIRSFDRQSFTHLLIAAGARTVTVDYVLNHMIAVARV